ncbi:MurR/RpiR family transcriptional regulator [Kineococcus sp. SYSU DK003]|uniref:MurR/RpiR family transcriptional regulator n=1 Tax=Kineococcus sp. SYSU DK003 TaxID=3383124 RepID=UPI003D7DBFE7
MVPPVTPWLDGLLPAAGLSPAQSKVFEAVRGDHQFASFAEVAAIAARAGVDNSTVVRCAQTLGFKGWPALQHEVRARYLATLSNEQTLDVHPSSEGSLLQQTVRRDIRNLEQALETVDEDVLAAAVKTLAHASRTLVLATGSLSAPATVLAHLGTTMGYDIHHEPRGGAHLAAAVNRLTAADALVVLNVWRPMSDLLAAVRIARSTGCPVVAMTDMYSGALAAAADHVLVLPSEGVSFFQSTTAATSVGYALLAGLEAERPEITRPAIRRIQELWNGLGTYTD